MKQGPYDDKDRLAMNKTLKQLQAEQQLHEQALAAGITEVQPIFEKCIDCQDKIKAIKATYFPNKP